jgi:peroxiredoxin
MMMFVTACGSAPSEESQMTVLQAKTAPQVASQPNQENSPALQEASAPQAESEPAAPVAAQSAPVEEASAVAAPVEAAPANDQPANAQVDSAAAASLGINAATDASLAQSPAVEPAPAAAANAEPVVGSLAPDFSLATLDGSILSLSALRGKNIMLNYWVTWCVPCIEEMPILQKLNQEYQGQNLVMLSINGIAQDDLEKVKATVAEFGMTYPVVLDEGDTIFKSYWLGFMPTTVFIDSQGVIRHIKFGGSNETELRGTIDQLLAGTL